MFSMKAIVFLIIILILAGAGYLGYKYYLPAQKTPIALTAINPVTSKPVSLTLDLSSPDDNLLVFDPDILIQGKTIPAATVILSLDDTDQILPTDDQGNFSKTIKLQNGVNQFTVQVFDNLGNTKSESRTIYYSTEKI